MDVIALLPARVLLRQRTSDRPPVEPCFGVGCSRRAHCSCYREVEFAPGGTTVRGTCLRNGDYGGFRPAAEHARNRPLALSAEAA